MKKMIPGLLFSFLFLFTMQAQEDFDDEYQTIFDGRINSFSGFGGLYMNFSQIDGDFAHMMGGAGGILLNKSFFFGGYGMGLTTKLDSKQSSDEVDFSHGGFWTGFIIQPNKSIHPVLSLQTGWGEVTYKEHFHLEDSYNDNVFVINPVAEIELNITKFFRVGLGANYRLVFGTKNDAEFQEKDLSGPGIYWNIKFGWF